jgi:hypothetical protein
MAGIPADRACFEDNQSEGGWWPALASKSPALEPSLQRREIHGDVTERMVVASQRDLTEGQRAYEAKRAAKAGMSLEKWLEAKQSEREAEERARRKAAAVEAAKQPKKPGLIARLLERAHKPL